MRHCVLIFFFLTVFVQANAQEFIGGLTADYNTGIGERYTYGLGFHAEHRLGKHSNWYLNWHYTVGSNTHGEFYAHAGIPILMYRSGDWWDTPVRDVEDALAILLGPLLCPSGVTYYVKQHPSQNYRFGLYCNPLAFDYWKMKPYQVASWTIESGVKFLWYMNNDRVLYVSGGMNLTNNIRRGYRWYGNEALVGIQVGLLGFSD